MAETEKSEQPQTNGLENGLDEEERLKMRPADIDADVKEMERRKRVEMIMNSKLFREELERIIELQMKDGNGPAGLLQQISDMMGIQSGKLHTTHMFRGSNCLTPINDIRGVESMGYEKGEKNLRCKLASVFRLMDLYGWSQGINNQITARLNQDEEHFLVNPHGMLYNEITASSLVKVDMQGNIVEPGTTNFSVNTQGFLLHSAIHASRPDVNCVIHIKTPSVLAVSSLKCGLLPICQEALVIGEVSQHPFLCGIFEPEEREKIIRNLGPHNKVLLLHNHGAVCCGATIEEAFYNVYNTVLACETQMKLMPIGVENLLLVSDETRKQVYDAAHKAPEIGASGEKKPKQFRVGEMEFEALIRMLDNAGFRTGYIYRHPLVKCELPKPKNDVEVPPAVSSLGYLIEEEELYKQGNWKKYIDGRNRLDRTKWLNSPNVYQKVEILETGTSDPKKITKWVDQNSEEWVAESSPTHSSTPVKIESALQFVPKGTNPKEFKKLQQQIKANRRADKITSGPQSHILEGVSWEDAKKLQDANITQTGDQVILVGAASKGIIQRNYQHNALVYKTPYAKNPFDSMSDKEIEDYKQLVERKQRGDTDYEESQSESEAISSSRQDALRHFKSPLLSPQSATSETEEESRDEPRVLRIETKTAPRPIQAEVVLSDAESDSTDARVERSHSARYPKAEKPESVTLMNSFRKSWSLKREKDKSKDIEYLEDSRNIHPSLILSDYEANRMESLHCCVARIKQLTYKPVIVDVGAKAPRPLLKSSSEPSNLSSLIIDDPTEVDNHQTGILRDVNTSLSCSNIVSDLRHRLNIRKKLIYSAKMKFLGFHKGDPDPIAGDAENKENTPTSPMCALISEIRETINDIMSPERSKSSQDVSDDYFGSMRWIERPKFVPRTAKSELNLLKNADELKSKVSLNKSFSNLAGGEFDAVEKQKPVEFESFNDFQKDFQALPNDLGVNRTLETLNCTCGDILEGSENEDSKKKPKVDENQNEEESTDNVGIDGLKLVNASDEEATYTITDDSLLQTYSFTETTETEWYYNKTIMKLENSQTMLEIKEFENKDIENLAVPTVKYIDTGIDTDFTSEKENEIKQDDASSEKKKEREQQEASEDIDADVPICESSGFNKSSETDSSFLKSSSGRTSNDVDTSFAFKTETENSEKTGRDSPGNDSVTDGTKKFLSDMLDIARDPIEEESSDSGDANPNGPASTGADELSKRQREMFNSKLPGIPESPEFTNVDTEDAPVTSSSKDTSPEIQGNAGHLTEDEPLEIPTEPEVNVEKKRRNLKTEHKKKKNVKSSTEITVKKERKEKNSDEPIFSEIKLTIKNSNPCQSEKYEVKIEDVTNTSEDLSRSVSSAGENAETYESFEIVESNCDCDAQQNLEDLQGEVSSTIEKLQTIENYFEDEIKKHSKGKSSDEFTFEYNYREFEEVLNESRDKILPVKDSEASERLVHGKVNGLSGDASKSAHCEENCEYFISYLLDNICGEVEVSEEATGPKESEVCRITEEKEANQDFDATIGDFICDTVLNLIVRDPEGEHHHETKEVSLCSMEVEKTVSEILTRETSPYENSAVDQMTSLVDGNASEQKDKLPETDVYVVPNMRCFCREAEEESQKEEADAGDAAEKLLENRETEEVFEDVLKRICEEEKLTEVVPDSTGNQVLSSMKDVTPEYTEISEDPEHMTHCTITETENILNILTEKNEKGKDPDKEYECSTCIEGKKKPEEESIPESPLVDQVFSHGEDFKEISDYTKMQAEERTAPIKDFEEDILKNPATEDEKCPSDIAGKNQEVYIEETSPEDFREETNTKKLEILRTEEVLHCNGQEEDPKDSLKAEIVIENPEVMISLTEDVSMKEECQALMEQICMFALSLDFALDSQELYRSMDLGGGVREQVAEDLEVVADVVCDFENDVQAVSGFGQLEKQAVDDVVAGNNELEVFELFFKKLSAPLKAITWVPKEVKTAEKVVKTPNSSKKREVDPVEYILNFLLNSIAKDKSEGDLHVESPTNSLAEFEDMENIIFTSNSVVADIIDCLESQLEGDVESLPDEEETKDWEASDKRRGKKGDSIFKVTIATPTKKEIFINYSIDCSSSFNISSEFPGELCNSYIKTDYVNEDFENLSSDNPDFFSVGSPDKNSLNSSFCSTSSALETLDQFCCVNCETNRKSPRSLGIIQEVDEGDGSSCSELAVPSNP